MTIKKLNSYKSLHNDVAFQKEFVNEMKINLKGNAIGIPISELCYLLKTSSNLNKIINELYASEKKIDKQMIAEVIEKHLHNEIETEKKIFSEIQEFPYIIRNANAMPHYLAFFRKDTSNEFFSYYQITPNKGMERKVIKNKCLILYGEKASGRRRYLYELLKNRFDKSEDEIIDLTQENANKEVIDSYIKHMKDYHFRNRIYFLFQNAYYDKEYEPTIKAIKEMSNNYSSICIFIENEDYKTVADDKKVWDEVFPDPIILHLEGITSEMVRDEGQPYRDDFVKLQKNLVKPMLPIYAAILRKRPESVDWDDLKFKQEYCSMLFHEYAGSSHQVDILNIIAEFNSNEVLAKDYLKMLFRVIENEATEKYELNELYATLIKQTDIEQNNPALIEIKTLISMKVFPSEIAFNIISNTYDPFVSDFMQYAYLSLAIDILPTHMSKCMKPETLMNQITIHNKNVFDKLIEYCQLYFLLDKKQKRRIKDREREKILEQLIKQQERISEVFDDSKIFLL